VSAPTAVDAAPVRLTFTHWLIIIMAAIGFAFDTYALLVMPIIARPALAELLGVDRYTTEGGQLIQTWSGYITFYSAICGGVFGLLGGWLTDRFGRRTVLTYSILLYAGSTLASGFSTSATMLLILRCTTFIGVCVEFVAAVAWLAELFPSPKQRESILGYTQAFSSLGGIMVTASYWVINTLLLEHLPTIFGEQTAWRWTLISGVIPALPLMIIRPFLPESPVWLAKKEAGTLKRPSILELFQPLLLRTTLVTAALFACGFGAAFGAIQLTPQMVPGLFPDIGKRRMANLVPYEAAQDPAKLQTLFKNATDAEHPPAAAVAKKNYQTALEAQADPDRLQELRRGVAEATRDMEERVANIQFWQEIGGLVGRFVLAFLATVIVGRRLLLWMFQLPGLLLIPLMYWFVAGNQLQGSLRDHTVQLLMAGMFVTGFFTVAQFSFWGNYLPRVYPTHLRGTGESFAANVGGRMIGTAFMLVTVTLAPYMMRFVAEPGPTAQFTRLAFAAAAVALLVYGVGSILTFFLPQPKEESTAD
jgi:MFS family permease